MRFKPENVPSALRPHWVDISCVEISFLFVEGQRSAQGLSLT